MRRVPGFVSASGFLAFALTGLPAVPAGAQSAVTAQTLMSKLQWRNVGPFVGGRVVAVAGVPGKDNVFYAGTVGGGVLESTDYGLNWKDISDKLPGTSASIGAIAVAPSEPSVIYAGTGEDDIRNDMIPGDGIYKSSDAGKTWEYAGLRETRTISRIVVSPGDPNTVYASSMGHVFVPDPNRGVFKSTDGGKTWKKILFVDEKTGAIDLVMDPNNPEVLYATTWQAQRMPWGLISGGPGSGIYKTTDGGATWTNLTHNPGFPTGTLGHIGVSLVASQPYIVYAIVQAKDGGVFRSDDGGATWTQVNNEMKLRQRAFYYMAIFADPKDPNTVYAPQVDSLWVSHDGGRTWTRLHTPHGDNHIVWIDPKNTKILLEGNDGGVTVSTDGGKTWSSEHNQPTGQFYHVNLDDQFPFHIYGAQQDEDAVEGPSAGPGGIPEADWHTTAGGESTFSVPEPGDPDITFGSDYYTLFEKHDLKTDQTEGVAPWPLYQDGAAANELKYRFGWTHPILFSPVNPKELFTSAQVVLKSDDYGRTWTRISPDLTRNEPSTEIASGGPIDLDQSGAEVYPEVYSLAVSPLDGNLLWAGSDDGLVHVTADGGKNWDLVTPAGMPDSVVSSIEPSHVDKNTAYLTAWRYMWDDYRPYVYKTTDLGKHWTSITTGLPDDAFAFAVRQDPKDAQLLFLGTFSTVYVSLDGGAQWQPLKLNLPTAEVRDIAINNRQGDVVIATHGRSFWVLDNLALLEQLTKSPNVAADSEYVFAPESAWLTHIYGGGERSRPGTGQNPAFGATVFFHVPANYDGKTPVSLEFQDAQGNTVRKFALHLETAKEKQEEEAAKAGVPMPDRSGEPAVQQDQEALEKLTAINPGMNRFQWDMRYTPPAQVVGYHLPEPAAGEAEMVSGPIVVPGTYKVVLTYGGQKSEQSFAVALDPRLKATQQDLDAQLALCQQIEADLNPLVKDINDALAARDKLNKAVADGTVTQAQAASALNALNGALNDAVQMDNFASEEDLMHEVKLNALLAFLGADVEWGYTRPTAAQEAVFHELDGQTKTSEQKLEVATKAAAKVAP
ncbi:MAG: exo-alpha-sialidase [Acidobacteriaceae bacterium]